LVIGERRALGLGVGLIVPKGLNDRSLAIYCQGKV
jgi:hypothetical protein